MKKTLLVFSAMVFTALVIVAAVLYKERVLYVDSAYYAFNMINNEMPLAEHNRYSIYLLQIIPWGMLKCGFAISSVLCMFSVSHILVGIVAFILMTRLKQYKAALLLTLLQVLTYRESFFLALNETSILLACVLLLSAFMNHYGEDPDRRLQSFFAFFVCILIALFSHPMAMILCPFVILFNTVEKPGYKRNLFLSASSAFAIALAFRIALSKSSPYETDLYEQLMNAPELLGNFKNLNSFYFFFGSLDSNSYFFSIYIIPIFIFIYTGFIYFRDKNYKSAIFYVTSVIAFWFLIIIMFNRGDGNIFMEKNFTPWVFVCLYPLTSFDFKLPRISAVLYISVILYSFIKIAPGGDVYMVRYKLLDDLISKQNSGSTSKLLILDSTIDHSKWQSTWALPYESLLLCKIKNLPNTTAKVYHNEEAINKELYRKDIFLGADFFPVLPTKKVLNEKFFRLEEVLYVKGSLENDDR